MPFLYVSYKKHQRLQKFVRQLPEALDLIARALRAGHTFQVGLKMVGEEFADPIGTEFDKTLAEINFGAGIPEAVRPRIFEPFFTTKEVGKGTGQGLAIARATIVKKHGGTLTFDSTAGVGTTFIIRIPMSTAEVPAEPQKI